MTHVSLHTPARRGLTLVELSISVALSAVLVAASLDLVGTVRRTAALDTARSKLALAAQAQLARLCATPWDNLKIGETPLSGDNLREWGFDEETEKIEGRIRVRDVEGLDLREIQVFLVYHSIYGPLEQTLSVWRGR